jgi:hypothetical protein
MLFLIPLNNVVLILYANEHTVASWSARRWAALASELQGRVVVVCESEAEQLAGEDGN